MPPMNYELGEGRLTIHGALAETLDLAFEINCRRLLDSKTQNLVVDLTGVNRITSMYLGSLAMAASEASTQGRTLTVRVNPQIADLIRQVGFDRIMLMEVIEERAAGAPTTKPVARPSRPPSRMHRKPVPPPPGGVD